MKLFVNDEEVTIHNGAKVLDVMLLHGSQQKTAPENANRDRCLWQ